MVIKKTPSKGTNSLFTVDLFTQNIFLYTNKILLFNIQMRSYQFVVVSKSRYRVKDL